MIKLLVIGNSNAGKTQLINRFVSNKFDEEYRATIACDFAIKILEMRKIAMMSDRGRVAREIKILKEVKHRNIIQLYEIIETSYAIYMIMEYAEGGELFDYIVNKGRLTEKEAAFFYY